MKTQTKIFAGITVVALMLAFLPLVFADECVGQNCGANINLTIGNNAPTIPYVEPVSAITLNGGTTKSVTVSFNATDTNGYADLDVASAKVELINGATIRTLSSCSSVSDSGDTSEIECTGDLNFYDDAGSWTVNASIEDLASLYVENASTSATVNALDYVEQDVNYFAWATATLGTNDLEADNQLTLTNGGNQDYTTMNIKGQDATYSTSTIDAEQFSVDNVGSATTGQIYMIGNTNVDVSAKLGLTTHGASVTEVVYAYVDVPTGILSGLYQSTSAWEISLT